MLSPLNPRQGVLSRGLTVIFLTLLAARTLVAQTGEYPIGGAISGDQDFPSISLGGAGGYVVWEDNRIEGAKYRSGIAAQALGSDLTATGGVFRVNHQLTGSQEKPQVLVLGNGNTLFTWESRQGTKPGVFARLLGTNGKFLTSDLQLNGLGWTDKWKCTTNWFSTYRNVAKNRKYKFRESVRHVRELAGGISLAPLPDGGALVAFQAARRAETNTYGLVRRKFWSGIKVTTNDYLQPFIFTRDWMLDVFFQRLDANGNKVGSEVLANQYTDYNQRTPSAAVLVNGNIAMAWVSEFPDSANAQQNFRVEIVVRLFNPQGEPLGDEFLISPTDDRLAQANPVVSAVAGGGFSVYWSQQESASSRRWDVYGQNFGTDGASSGPAFRVNEYTTGDQFAPKAAASGDQQLIVWTSVGQDGSREGVYGRWLSGGALSGAEFLVNTTTAARQHHPAVAVDSLGLFLTVWSSFAGGTGFDLFGQQHVPPASE